LIEALIALAIIGILAVPISAALHSIAQGILIQTTDQTASDFLQEKLEEISAMRFDKVTLSDPPGSASALSDSISLNGESVERTVIVDLADGDGDGASDEDLKCVTVRIGGREMMTLIVDL